MSLATITAKARLIPRDFGESFQAKVTGDGVTQRFELPRDNVDSTNLTVATVLRASAASLPLLLNPIIAPIATPAVLSAATSTVTIGSSQYYLDARRGVITLGIPLALGNLMTVDGTTYLGGMLPDDITNYIAVAFDMHIKGRFPVPTVDTLPVYEEYLVALLVYREFLWGQVAQAAQEINVDTPEGMHIPEGQRYQQLFGLLERVEAHYRELSAIMGVGLYRIEMATLRRVSRTTNRLVPVYAAQEFDDHNIPTRIYPPIDQGGSVTQPAGGVDGGTP